MSEGPFGKHNNRVILETCDLWDNDKDEETWPDQNIDNVIDKYKDKDNEKDIHLCEIVDISDSWDL